MKMRHELILRMIRKHVVEQGKPLRIRVFYGVDRQTNSFIQYTYAKS